MTLVKIAETYINTDKILRIYMDGDEVVIDLGLGACLRLSGEGITAEDVVQSVKTGVDFDERD